MSADQTPAPLNPVQQRLFEQFVALCGDPDNATVAADVDRSLHELDALLAREVG